MRNSGIRLMLAAGVLTIAACSSSEEATKGSSAPPAATAAAASVTPAMLEKGRAIYKTNCVPCHGETGKGDGPGAGVLKPPPRDHTDRAYMDTLSDKEIGDIIKMGGAIKGKPLMPSHPQLSGGDLEAIVAYVRSLSAAASGQ